MQDIDYLNLKTTNINVRISPILKSQLIERGAKMGVTLSDYIGHVLTRDMTGHNDPKHTDEYKDLERKCKTLQTELLRFSNITEPFKAWIGKDMTVDGKHHRFENGADLLAYFAQTFKVRL